MLALLQSESHKIGLFAVMTHPERVEDLVADLHVPRHVFVVVKCNLFVHPKRHHIQCFLFQYEYLPIKYARVRIDALLEKRH